MKALKKATLGFIAMLRKEQVRLEKKDAFNAEILSKIIVEAERLSWESALEECIVNIYKYCIPIEEETRQAIEKLLNTYERPDWTFRGPDEFGDMYDDLIAHYCEDTE